MPSTAASRIDEAIEHLTEAIRLKPNFHEAYNNLGELYLKNNRAEEAIAPLEKASQIYPQNPLPCLNLARAWRLLAREDLAEKYMARAAALGMIDTAIREGK